MRRNTSRRAAQRHRCALRRRRAADAAARGRRSGRGATSTRAFATAGGGRRRSDSASATAAQVPGTGASCVQNAEEAHGSGKKQAARVYCLAQPRRSAARDESALCALADEGLARAAPTGRRGNLRPPESAARGRALAAPRNARAQTPRSGLQCVVRLVAHTCVVTRGVASGARAATSSTGEPRCHAVAAQRRNKIPLQVTRDATTPRSVARAASPGARQPRSSSTLGEGKRRSRHVRAARARAGAPDAAAPCQHAAAAGHSSMILSQRGGGAPAAAVQAKNSVAVGMTAVLIPSAASCSCAKTSASVSKLRCVAARRRAALALQRSRQPGSRANVRAHADRQRHPALRRGARRNQQQQRRGAQQRHDRREQSECRATDDLAQRS